MADVVATAVVEEAVRGCFQAIGRHISFIRKYKINLNNLKVERKKLEDARSTVSARVRTAENNAEDIFKNVLGWQKRCDELLVQANDFLNNEMSFHVSCLCCNCPNIRSRYSASREVARLAPSITRHLEECTFDKVGQEPELGMLPLLSPGEFHGVGSRMEIMKEVMDDLQNDSICIIGLCGMGGIGKTTLAKQIAEEVKTEKLFDEVAFVVVSHDKNVKAIQDQLASRLGLKSTANEIDIHGRAELLYKRLMDEKKKILIILDDIWEELNLRSVGIPIHGDRDGFKILMTSRFHRVCTDMKVQKRLELGILSGVEAWNLFNETADISDVSILHIAKEVAQECGGLPLAIVTVAKSLRNKKEHGLRNVLRKLRDPIRSNTSRIHDVLYSCIKSSYDYLDSDDHRLLLLLCSLFPQDYDITMEDLVRYARGLFDTFETMAEARDRVEDIVDDLMKCYLLLQGEIRNCVKLHDVVRDVCISIASKSDDVHISLNFNDLKKESFGMKSQRLRLLRMVNEEYFWKSAYHSGGLKLENTLDRDMAISEEMQELRVLELNRITTRVPSSLQFMIKLQTLSLDYCRLQGAFAGIASLKMLRILSFFHSIVEVFPMGIAELTNLQCLDLRFMLEHPVTLPLRTLSNLKELEELYLGNIDLDIGSLKEVCFSSKLHTIQFVVKDDESFEGLLRNLNLSKLIRFHITRDLEDGGEIEYQVKENVLDLHQKNVHTDLKLLKELMRRVEWFYLNGNGLTNPIGVLGENGFQNLKELKLHDCDMEYLINATDDLAQCDFSKLETLRIHNGRKLEELIYGDLPVGTPIGNFNVSDPLQSLLGNLRRLEIFQCGRMKCLFSKSMVNCLGTLEFIKIKFCPTFERFVRIQKVDEVDSSQGTEFPKLKHLTLNELPEFLSLGPGSDMGAGLNEVMLPKLEHLTIMLHDTLSMKEGVEEVCSYLGSSLPKVRYMHIMKCNNLLTIAKSGLVHGFQDLQTLRVRVCSSVEVIFDFEKIMGRLSSENQVTTVLAQLEELDLSYLTKLKQIWRLLPPKGTPVFPNLKKIQVKGCNNLIHLLTPSITKMLVHLEEIKLQDNNLMDTIIGIDEIYMPNDEDQILFERLILPKLESLTIERLPSLRKLCSPQLNILELPSLNKLVITFMVQDIFTIDQSSRLTKLSIGRIDHHAYSLTPSSAKLLPSVRELELCDDEQIEAILGSDEAGGDDTTKKSIALPELRKMTIRNLPNFRKLCSSPDLNLELPSLTEFQMINCPFYILSGETHALQNLRNIKVEKCDKLNYLPTSLVQIVVHLEELVLRDNQSMFAIFEPRRELFGWWDDVPGHSFVLPKLRKLEISNLPNFRVLCSNSSLDLPSLVQLWVEDCPKMSKLYEGGHLNAPHLTTVVYGSTEIALKKFIHSWLQECESMIRCLDCRYHGYDTCPHFASSKATTIATRPIRGRSNSNEAIDEYLHTAPTSLASSAQTPRTSASRVSSSPHSLSRRRSSKSPSSFVAPSSLPLPPSSRPPFMSYFKPKGWWSRTFEPN